jgi:hypothetical protein
MLVLVALTFVAVVSAVTVNQQQQPNQPSLIHIPLGTRERVTFFFFLNFTIFSKSS